MECVNPVNAKLRLLLTMQHAVSLLLVSLISRLPNPKSIRFHGSDLLALLAPPYCI
jgi:hypothetical protein